MRFGALSASWKLAATANRLLLISNVALALVVAGLAPVALMTRERVTVMPPTLDKPYSVGWNSATPDYLKSMGVYFSGVIGMTGPRTLKYVLEVVDTFAAPAVAEGIKTKLRLLANTYEFKNSTSSAWFEAAQPSWEQATRKVFVPGHLHTVTAAREENVQPVVYEYVIDIVEGRPVIVHFDSYSGDVPHAQVFFADKKRAEADEKRRQGEEKKTLTDLGVEPANAAPGTPAGATPAPAVPAPGAPR